MFRNVTEILLQMHFYMINSKNSCLNIYSSKTVKHIDIFINYYVMHTESINKYKIKYILNLYN